MVDTTNVFFTTVAPSIGIAVATLLFLAPINKVIAVIRSGQLGDLNPLPYPFIASNCAAWALGFAVVTVDPYIFFANFLGLCTGVFYTLGTYPLATYQMRKAIMVVSVVATAYLALVGFIGVWTDLDAGGLRTLWGWAANIILVLFYMSPLATLWGVLRRRDASSIHWPLALMTVINGLLWVFYGLALSDAFIWAPNGFGAVVGGMNLMLRCLFPARKSRFARIAQPPPTATPVQPSTTTQLPTDAAVIPPPLVASYPPSCPPSASEGCKDVEGTLSSLSGGTDPTGRGPGVVSAGGVGGGGEGHGTHDGGEGGGDVYEVGDVELGGRMDSSAPLHTTAHS